MSVPSRLVISEIVSGMQTYEKPFFINNDSFPILKNAVCWRKSLRKKQGSSLLGRLQRTLSTKTLTQTSTAGTQTIIVDVLNDTGVANPTIRSLQTNAAIAPGTVSISFNGGAATWNDATTHGVLTATGGTAADGTINYSTGQIVLNFTGAVAGGLPIVVTLDYNPDLPVMGIEQFESDKSPNTQIDFPINVFLDTTYAYQFNGTKFYDVSFYKGTNVPITWNGQNFQQFDSSNYFRAMFTTNNNPGFHFLNGTYTAGTGTPVITFNFQSGGTNFQKLVIGDILWFNEWTTPGVTINGLSGTVTNIAGAALGNYQVTFTGIQTVGGIGITQMMTNQVAGQDGIRWYDGDPTLGTGLGWVNFAPPLDNLKTNATTYLIGCRIIIPFGNRLLAIGTFEATSANATTPTYYGNRIRFCEVTATPFYSLPTPSPGGAGTTPIGVEPRAWASAGIQGFGGFIDLDTTERIISAAITQGSLILGLETEQRRMSNTGIEIDPFSLQTINPDFGTAGTHAVVPMDKGILTVGEYGFMITSSYDSQRFDQPIIDQIFQVNQTNNGYERICGARDFVNEVIYFTYFSDQNDANNTFPDTTVVYNYRVPSFAVWFESFTTYGLYKNSTAQTWQTYFTPWETWFENWEDLGPDRFSKPFVAGGNQQGYVLLKWDENSFNHPSLYIQAIVANVGGTYTITSPNHNLSTGMYLGFWSDFPGSGTPPVILPSFNGKVNNIISSSQFVVGFGTGALPGNIVAGIWQMSIVDLPDIWTKQFQLAWSGAQKTRIGAQKYFLDTTNFGEFTVNMYGSQSDVTLNNPSMRAIISSNIVRTRPDDSLGLNDNAKAQLQIWHRMSTSAIGDTVQLEYTFSDSQMLDVSISTSPWVLYSTILDLYPSRTLA